MLALPFLLDPSFTRCFARLHPKLTDNITLPFYSHRRLRRTDTWIKRIIKGAKGTRATCFRPALILRRKWLIGAATQADDV
jgi:hypothetical protein